jgi:hypothetical protein
MAGPTQIPLAERRSRPDNGGALPPNFLTIFGLTRGNLFSTPAHALGRSGKGRVWGELATTVGVGKVRGGVE